MSKKHKQKRQSRQNVRGMVPSAQTVFRFTILDFETRRAVDQAAESLGPELWARDRDSVEKIERAKTADELLDLAVIATGMAEPTWFKRVRQFGPGIVPLMTQRLKSSRDIADATHQTLVREHLIAALRWRGTLGANALQECFADLDEYAQSLVSVVFGVLHARSSADLIGDLFQRTKQYPEKFFVGALWGLIDLQDPRIADALAELIQLERVYYEMFGFIARAGDERTVMPMVSVMVHGNESEREQAGYTLSAIAHRVAREKVIEALAKDISAEQRETVERMVDKLLQYPMDAIEDYFEMYYRGMA